MNINKIKQEKRERRHNRVRFKISGTTEKPRLSVFKSNRGMYLQLIDDSKNQTIVSVQIKEIKIKDKKTNIATEMGKLLAQKALAKKIDQVVFDRGGYKYHGRIKAVADGAREAGLKF
ncbi:MAG: 50S ribosomal protein L18 [Planctomycetes bacterium]|jgi:large subunit ribosomal protein L18|nr:50S ribosomal protein L18 [Planctomycetota bacterium]